MQSLSRPQSKACSNLLGGQMCRRHFEVMPTQKRCLFRKVASWVAENARVPYVGLAPCIAVALMLLSNTIMYIDAEMLVSNTHMRFIRRQAVPQQGLVAQPELPCRSSSRMLSFMCMPGTGHIVTDKHRKAAYSYQRCQPAVPGAQHKASRRLAQPGTPRALYLTSSDRVLCAKDYQSRRDALNKTRQLSAVREG